MTKEEAIEILKENVCSMCAYGSQSMMSCDIRGCDNRDAIKALEQEPEWIPVSERLPKNSGNYLIAIADSNYTNGQYYKISWFYPSNEEWSYRNAAVIAWMPLPEPYNAESEDGNENNNIHL